MFCAKNRLKKHQIFEKWDDFENRQSRKAYSLCRIVTLDQKFKFQTTCHNLFYKWFTVVLCKKPLEKKKIFEKWDDFENRQSRKAYSLCRIVTLGQKFKFQTTCHNPFYKWFTVLLCKKPLEKSPNIREMRRFWKSPIMQSL